MAVATTRRRVLFPAPFGPRRSTTSPRSTLRSTRTMAGATPNTRVTPVRETAGVSVDVSPVDRLAASTLLIPREATRRTGYRSPFANEWSIRPRALPICGTSRPDARLSPLLLGTLDWGETRTRSFTFARAPTGRARTADDAHDRMPVRGSAGGHGAGPED